MFSRRAPNLLLVSVIALWGVAGQPLNRDASAATRPALIAQHGEAGGDGSRSAERIVTIRVKGDPDDFTQTGSARSRALRPDTRWASSSVYSWISSLGVLIGRVDPLITRQVGGNSGRI
jgi:hypothetical protein